MLIILFFWMLELFGLTCSSCRNYVVQFILDLKIPSATSNLVSQFEGNYLHLSTQKFSSHVVEKCLSLLKDEHRSRIIHELLSSSHFERLLQDPHANYVIQTALRVTEVWNFYHSRIMSMIFSLNFHHYKFFSFALLSMVFMVTNSTWLVVMYIGANFLDPIQLIEW